jgi:hypothetical protein
MNIEYIFAIPTYQRYTELNTKTLSLLKRYSISSKKIYIFVADEEEQKKYEEQTPREDYNEIVVGALGITNQRNFITSYFSNDKYIISIDDDIEKILYLETELSAERKDINNLEELIKTNYDLMKENNCDTWGIYPVNNAFFMKNQKQYTYDFRFIIGCFYGFINNKKYVLSTDCKVKEDYERSVLSYMNCGNIMRCNHISLKTKFFALGGVGKNRTEKNIKAVEYLVKEYPLYFARKFRKDGRHELRIIKQNNLKCQKNIFDFESI